MPALPEGVLDRFQVYQSQSILHIPHKLRGNGEGRDRRNTDRS